MGFMSKPRFDRMAANVPVSEAQSIANMFKAAQGRGYWRDKKRQVTEAREALARYEMRRFKNIYEGITITNPYRDMENAFEDLTINQQQNNFEQQTFQQSQSNILNTIRQTTGSSGISSVAQSLAQQGQIAAQRSAANIGLQEQQLQVYAPQEQARLDQLEASGRNLPQMFEKEKMAKLMGMSQMEMFAHINEQHKIDADASKAAMAQWGMLSSMLSMGAKSAGGGGGVAT